MGIAKEAIRIKFLSKVAIICLTLVSAMFVANLNSEKAYAYDGNADGAIAKVTACYTQWPRSYYVRSIEDMENCIADMVSRRHNPMLSSYVSIDLLQDIKADRRLELTSDKYYRATFELHMHGHYLSRDLDAMPHKAGVSKGEVIYCGFADGLKIYGTDEGDPEIQHRWSLIKNGDEEFFKLDDNGDQVMIGGLITGGLCNDHWAGGGISVSCYLSLNNVTVAGNVSQTWGSSYGHGGGICARIPLDIDINNSSISYNYAEGWGGGIYIDSTYDNVKIRGNSKIEHNTAGKYGGGIAMEAGSGSHYTPSLELWDNTSVSNNLTYGDGGGIYLDEWNCPRLVMRGDSKVSSNVAKGNGGGVAIDADETYVNFENQASILNNHADKEGGGMYICDEIADWTVDGNSKISGNTAGGKGGGMCMHEGGFSPQTFRNTGNLEFSDNYGECGGAFYSNYGTNFKMFSDEGTVTFKNNKAKYNGGAIAAENGEGCGLQINNATFEGNSAHTGGAIWFRNDLSLKNASIKGNTATDKGGGVYCDNSGNKHFVINSKVEICENSIVDGKGNFKSNNNLSLKGSQLISSGLGDDALTTECKIGITHESDKSEWLKGVINESKDFLKTIDADWKNCFFSDDPAKKIERQNTYLYLEDGKSTYQLTINSENGSWTDYLAPQTAVKLDSKDHKKVTQTDEGVNCAWVIDYWTVKYASGDGAVFTPNAEGIVEFNTGEGPTVATAHYVPAISNFEASITEWNQWEYLTSKDKLQGTYENKLVLGSNLTESAEITNEDVYHGNFKTERKVVDVTDDQGFVTSKKVTYTFVLSAKALKSAGLGFDENFLESEDSQFDVTFKSIGNLKAKANGVYKSKDDAGNVTFEYTVELQNPKSDNKQK